MDRLFIAAEVTRRMAYLHDDVRKLEELLAGETLSPDFHADLQDALARLGRLAKRTEPRKEAA